MRRGGGTLVAGPATTEAGDSSSPGGKWKANTAKSAVFQLSLKTVPKMYTASKTSSTAVVPTTAQPPTAVTTAEPLTYWTDARSSNMARPNPSVSNCGLVIVQVENNRPFETAENRTFYQEPQSLTNWSNITLDNR